MRRVASSAVRLGRCLIDDPALTLELFLWRVSLPALKHAVPVARLARLMWTQPSSDRSTSEQVAHVRSMLERGGRVLSSANCLERSLLLYRLLSRAGVSATLWLGTKVGSGGLAGHAWVEIDGVPFGEPNAGEYTRLVTFGTGGSATPASVRDAA